MATSVSIRDLSLSFGAVTVLKDLNLDRPLIVTEDATDALFLAARNLPYVQVRDARGIDPVSLVGARSVVITVDAVKKIEEWLA
jgi:large subunit ribosomal protein L4